MKTMKTRGAMKMNKTSYQQAEGKWAGLGYPKKPYYIRNCGCGEVAITNILVEMLQYLNYDPATIQPYMKQFAEARGNGTYHYGIPTAMKHYGFTDVKECPDMKSLWKELEKGDRVAVYLMGSRDAGSKKVHWTGSGHFVASVEYKKVNGKHYVYMKDSASKSSLRTGWITYEQNLKNAVLRVWVGKIPDGKRADGTTSAPTETVKETEALTVDGIGGPATIRATQKYFGETQDGVISGQQKKQKQFYPSLTAVSYGSGGSVTVKALQKWAGTEADGILGKGTAAAWQHKLKEAGFYTGIVDGIFGAMSMKAWQNYLNKELYGVKDPEPTKTSGTTGTGGSTSGTSASSDYIVIDVSYAQKAIDWKKVKAAGIKGAMIRCGYRGYESAKLEEDAYFLKNIKAAHAAGIMVGVYFFTEGITAKEGKEEATYTVSLIKKAGIPLSYPVAVDTEHINAKNVRANNLSKAKRTEVIKAFCEEIKAQGYEPMIYACTSWLNNNLDMSKLPYKVWVAQYYDKVTYKGSYVMWQYTSTGKLDGINGVVDKSHCYIKIEQKSAQNNSKVITTSSKVTTTVAALSIEELAKQVIEGKWGSGQDRKKNLEKAGYNYDKVQAKVNEMLADNVLTREEVIAKGNAWARKICADNRYHYNLWNQKVKQSHLCPICSGLDYKKDPDHFGWNCIGLTIAIWHHGMGLPCKCNCYWITGPNGTGEKLLSAKTDAEALELAKQYTGLKDVMIIRNKNGIPKKQWKAGDICLKFSGDTFQHAFYYPGGDTVIDSTRIYTDKSKWTSAVIANQIKERSYKNYSAKVIVRWTGGTQTESLPAPTAKKSYTGQLPSTKLVKTNAEVIEDAIKFGKWIAGDNSFHYGYTNKKVTPWYPNAHHNGCYFCRTNVDHGGRSKKGIVDFEKTYCCNPLCTACYAHGGCDPAALKKCKSGSSYTEKSFKSSKNWKKLGKPKFSELKKGDILYWEKKDSCHYAMLVSKGKLLEASHGDDNKRGSKKWNDSIHIRSISGWGSFQGAFRYIGSVNTTCCIYHGEVGTRVVLLQEYINWYTDGEFFKKCGPADGIFGDNTLKYVKKMQKDLGVTDDGIVGPNTIAAMGKAVK